jgi:hypothetical protein
MSSAIAERSPKHRALKTNLGQFKHPVKKIKSNHQLRGEPTVAKRQATPRLLMAQTPCRFTPAGLIKPSIPNFTYWLNR